MPDPDEIAYTGSLFPSFPSQTPSLSASRAVSSDVRAPTSAASSLSQIARHALMQQPNLLVNPEDTTP